MSNIAAVLKTEIARVARKEVRGDLDIVKKASASYRREIAALKKRLADLERKLKRVASASRRQEQAATAQIEGDDRQIRFSPARFGAQRKKLGLSAADFAKLIGVSALSVYKWEGGKARPRRVQLVAIASIRGIGKREAQARLEQMRT